MIDHFLRLFPRYRALLSELSVERARVTEIEDSRRALQIESHQRGEEIERLREDLRETRAGERSAYQMMVNVSYQRQYGWIPFPEAPHIPEHSVSKSAGGPVEEAAVRVEELYRKKMAESKDSFMELFA